LQPFLHGIALSQDRMAFFAPHPVPETPAFRINMSFNTSAEISGHLIERLGGDRFRGFIRIYRAWRIVVGDLLAERSHPFRFKEGVLYVAVSNSSWMQELVLRKGEILSRCVQISGEAIQEVIFLIRT